MPPLSLRDADVLYVTTPRDLARAKEAAERAGAEGAKDRAAAGPEGKGCPNTAGVRARAEASGRNSGSAPRVSLREGVIAAARAKKSMPAEKALHIALPGDPAAGEGAS
jgi:hypothetical protein